MFIIKKHLSDTSPNMSLHQVAHSIKVSKLKLVTVKWCPFKKKTLQIKRKQSRVRQSTRQRGAKRKRNWTTCVCVWQWYDLRNVCVWMTNVQSIFSENTESYFTEKGLLSLHMTRKCQNTCLRSNFEKYDLILWFTCFLTHVKEMSVHMSKILFSKNNILFLNYICPYMCQRNVRTYV